MNERQRDLFLFQWSRRRAPGGTRIALRGALIGALGGMAFAWMLLRSGARTPGVYAYDIAGQITSALTLLAASVPTFAAIGWSGARRVWRSNEMMYQRLLAAGARVPERKPELRFADRGPLIAVVLTFVAIAGLIAWLWWAASTGRL